MLPLTCRLCRFRPRSLAPADFISVLANVVGKKADRRRHGPHRSVCRTSRSLKIKYCGSELLVCFRTQFCRGASDSQEGMDGHLWTQDFALAVRGKGGAHSGTGVAVCLKTEWIGQDWVGLGIKHSGGQLFKSKSKTLGRPIFKPKTLRRLIL